jgi:hypothetical protein
MFSLMRLSFIVAGAPLPRARPKPLRRGEGPRASRAALLIEGRAWLRSDRNWL